MRTLLGLIVISIALGLVSPASAQMMQGRSHMQNKSMMCPMMSGKGMMGKHGSMCPCMSSMGQHKKQGG
jgi:hypothetical protein